jgi:nucleotide-binding universal stress UspA family protein
MFPVKEPETQDKVTKLKRILVAVSGNAADEDAVNLACHLSKKNKAELFILYILEVQRSLPLDAVVQSELNKAEQILSRAEDIASENDCEVTTDLIQAREVGAAIVDDAVEKKVDVIFMGLEYKKRFGSFNLGEAIPYVLEEAPCDVILVRRAISKKVKL